MAEAMLTFFDFPAEHWDHLRMSNPPLGDCRQSPAGQRVENVFATVRHRTVPTKGAVSQKTVKPMVFTLIRAASKTWRRLNGAKGRLRHQRRQIHRRSRKHRSRQNQRRFITPRHPNSSMAPDNGGVILLRATGRNRDKPRPHAVDRQAVPEDAFLRCATEDVAPAKRGPCRDRKAHPAADAPYADLPETHHPLPSNTCLHV